MSSKPSSRETDSLPVASPEAVQEFLDRKIQSIDAELHTLLPRPSKEDGGVAEAMRYTTLAPGKRIRPVLTLAVSDLYGVSREEALPAACAIEMVHACSLILDDLPCMDDASTRRGRATNHIVHGEATAILAAFALLNQAYGLLAGAGGEAVETVRSDIGRRLSLALGTEGVIGGQALDLALEPAEVDIDRLERIHSRKTGSLFIASLEVGAILGRAPHRERAALGDFAKNLGLAYQIHDDLLDVEGDPSQTGKPCRTDRRGNFVTLAGREGARRLAGELVECALQQLTLFQGRASMLAGLARQLTHRSR